MSLNRANLTILITVIIIGLFGFFVIKPLFYNLKNLTIDYKAKNNDAIALKDKLTNLQKVKTEFSRFQSQVEKILLAMPENPEISDIIAMIQGMADASGVSVQGIDPAKTENAQASGQDQIQVTTEGNYQNLISFCQKVEANIRPIKIQSVDISSASEDSSSPSLTMTFNLIFYSIPKENKSATTTTNPAQLKQVTEEGVK